MSFFLSIFLSLIVATFLQTAAFPQEQTAQAHRLGPTGHFYIDAEGKHRILDSATLVYRTLVGEMAVAEQDFSLAAVTFIELAQDTEDPRYAQRAFRLAMAEQDINLGVQAAQLWAQLDPENPDARASALALEASTGETEGMAHTLRQRIEVASDKEQAVAQAMGIVSRMVDPFLALEVFEAALPADVRDLMVTHMALADLAWAAQEPQRAADEALAALQRSPESESAAMRVLEYGLAVDPDQAFVAAGNYARNHPQSRQLHLMLVNRLVDYDRHRDALSLLDDMSEHNPEDFDLMFIEAEVYRQGGDYEQAKALLHEYIEVQTQRRLTVDDAVSTALSRISDARLALVQIAEQQGDFPEAIRQLDLIEEPDFAFQAREIGRAHV